MSEAEIRIPKERVGVLIGKNGKIKKKLEELTNCKIKVSRDGYVYISGEAPNVLDAMNVIKAIGRGFDEKKSMKLLKEGYILELINIKDFARTKNAMIRLRGRVIGTKGKSKKKIEMDTDTNISVYGKTIGIIGKEGDVEIAREAIEKLLRGAKHSKVFHRMEKEEKRRRLEIEYS